VDRQREPTVELQHEQLAAASDPQKPLALERRQRRIERPQRIDARDQRRLNLHAGDGAVDQARGDLDFG